MTVETVPAPARAVVDLLNSRAYAIHDDKLDSPAPAAEILGAFGTPSPSAAQLELVRALRSDLMAVVSADDPADTTRDWAAFSGRVSDVRFQQNFSTAGSVQLVQVTGDPLVGRISTAVAELVNAGMWSRIRLCANHECAKVFYDTTRSRTRRWHSYEICGNRANVAAYRARSN
jgi:predicted RNA-binding Zn ribbon-like protein